MENLFLINLGSLVIAVGNLAASLFVAVFYLKRMTDLAVFRIHRLTDTSFDQRRVVTKIDSKAGNAVVTLSLDALTDELSAIISDIKKIAIPALVVIFCVMALTIAWPVSFFDLSAQAFSENPSHAELLLLQNELADYGALLSGTWVASTVIFYISLNYRTRKHAAVLKQLLQSGIPPVLRGLEAQEGKVSLEASDRSLDTKPFLSYPVLLLLTWLSTVLVWEIALTFFLLKADRYLQGLM